MAELRIQYAKTSDGVSIAYSVFGEGTPLVYVGGISGMGLHFYSQFPLSRRGVDQLTDAGFQVIRYDARGTGSSDRSIQDFSLEAQLLELEAVVERLGLERFVLLGHFSNSRTAIAYATRRPERLSHLVLRDPAASNEDFHQAFPRQLILKAMRPFAEEQWELTTLNVAALGMGFADSDLMKKFSAAFRAGVTAGVWVAMEEAFDEIDVTGLLEEVRTPTLVVVDTSLPNRPADTMAEWSSAAKKVAAAIPDAHLVTSGDFAAAASEFVHGDGQATAGVTTAPTGMAGGFATILFTDVEGSTALTDRLGDAAARKVLREHERITREALKAHGGSEVKAMGDGFMASFGSATRALECAVALQRRFEVRREKGEVEELSVRVGLNAGEPIAEDDDLFGTAVIVAARVAAQASGGEVLVSDVVRQLVAGKGFLFNDRGEQTLKGFEAPVRVYEVRWGE